VTHFCPLKLTHTTNTICRRKNEGRAISSTLTACKELSLQEDIRALVKPDDVAARVRNAVETHSGQPAQAKKTS